MSSILMHPIFSEGILPFVLVFVLIFAILQKSKLLGDGKKQIDAFISAVIALILIVTPVARNFIVNLLPWLAVGLSVMLVFFILYGFVAEDKWKTEKWVKIVFGVLAGIFVIVIVLYVSGLWPTIRDFFSSGINSDFWTNFIIIVVVVGVFLIVVLTTKTKSETK